MGHLFDSMHHIYLFFVLILSTVDRSLIYHLLGSCLRDCRPYSQGFQVPSFVSLFDESPFATAVIIAYSLFNNLIDRCINQRGTILSRTSSLVISCPTVLLCTGTQQIMFFKKSFLAVQNGVQKYFFFFFNDKWYSNVAKDIWLGSFEIHL